jgi:hypothetical protein
MAPESVFATPKYSNSPLIELRTGVYPSQGVAITLQDHARGVLAQPISRTAMPGRISTYQKSPLTCDVTVTN